MLVLKHILRRIMYIIWMFERRLKSRSETDGVR